MNSMAKRTARRLPAGPVKATLDPHENGLPDIEIDRLPNTMGDNGQISNISGVSVFRAFLIESRNLSYPRSIM